MVFKNDKDDDQYDLSSTSCCVAHPFFLLAHVHFPGSVATLLIRQAERFFEIFRARCCQGLTFGLSPSLSFVIKAVDDAEVFDKKNRVLLQPATGVAAAGNKAAVKELEKIDGLFNQYADKAEDSCIGPDGIEVLCEDLGVSPTDIRVLYLAWKLQAARQGYFSLEEWRKGLKAMRVDSLDKLKKTLPALLQEVAYHFKDFYTFSFKYCLTEPRQKTLDLETACQMLDLVLGSRPHVGSFLQFLQEQSEYKAMNLDQWSAFLRFCDEIKPDLSNYDESQAWPLLLDNYVEWARKCMLTMS